MKLEITPKMKHKCHGEFFIDVEMECTACGLVEAQEDCEVCGGEIYYSKKIMVPWTTIKDIYRMMKSCE